MVHARQTGRGGASGVTVEASFWYVVRLEDGRAVGIDIYGSREQALAAVEPGCAPS